MFRWKLLLGFVCSKQVYAKTQDCFFFEDIFWVKFSQMIKTEADGQSEANTPLTHTFYSFIYFIQLFFLPQT